jgi:hypothetical protein
MPHIDVPHRGESFAQMAVRCRVSRFQQLVGDLRESADHDHWLRILSALHDAGEAADRRRILHRRATELHHDHIVVSLKPALSLLSAHIASLLWQRKTHRQIASGGGFGWVILFKSALLHPTVLQKTRNSCRHTYAVVVIRLAFWTRVFIRKCKESLLRANAGEKFKIPMAVIRFSAQRGH